MDFKKLVITLLATVCMSCGGEQISSDLNIINGLTASDSEFPSVVKIIQYNTDGSNSGCTATFISPSLAITAAHCLELTRTRVTVNGFPVKRWYRPQQYNSEWWNYDVAIVDLGADVSAHYTPLSCNPPVKGDELTIVGFGRTDLYNDTNHFVKKHYGRNTVEQVSQGRLSFKGSDKPLNPTTGTNVLNANGDSGGPMFVNGKIVGVSSSINVLNPGVERTGYYTNLNYAPIKSYFQSLVRNNNLKIGCE